MSDSAASRVLLFLLPILLQFGCAKQVETVTPGVSLELAKERAALISKLAYQLDFDIPEDPASAIDGRVSVRFSLADSGRSLQLDFREKADKIRAIRVNGERSDYRFTNEHIVIRKEELQPGENVIDIEFVAGDSSLNRNPDYLYTLFVPDRARTAFPLFDQPDLKATWTLSLTVPRGWLAMSNAAVESVREVAGKTAIQFAESDSISSYLFSFVAGKFTQIDYQVGDRQMSMLHRETDQQKVSANLEEIFRLHAAALDWLEEYTGIPYPYKKFGFALIPAFQYGGMEHVGAIQYRASALFLDESPSEQDLLRRAGLIAHETAHMWFGNLVTMAWFNDVWTKEVFANFMAAKIVNPDFPAVNHDLNFLTSHYPRAYSVDRTEGANPIRQVLDNLNEAGQMYGAIIYNKAPIMMRQLETMIGVDTFRDGMQEYLRRFAFGNATWPALIEILDSRTEQDLKSWSEVWVNSSGRPAFELQSGESGESGEDGGSAVLVQLDPAGRGRVWPQQFSVAEIGSDGIRSSVVTADSRITDLNLLQSSRAGAAIYDADGQGYGLFPLSTQTFEAWADLDELLKGTLLVNAWENMLEGTPLSPPQYLRVLQTVIAGEDNVLVLNLALRQMQDIYWRLLSERQRLDTAPALEALLWDAMLAREEPSQRKIYFEAFVGIALTERQVDRAFAAWSGGDPVENLVLSENDRIDLAQTLAVKIPQKADEIIALQLDNTENPDSLRKLRFIAPSLSPDRAVRDQFFASLADETARQTESWVLDALRNLHHPLRIGDSERYLPATLELLQEVQVTGDIFFPKRWLDVSLANHRSSTAVTVVRDFLAARPDYNAQLRMKILQAADPVFRANRLLAADPSN